MPRHAPKVARGVLNPDWAGLHQPGSRSRWRYMQRAVILKEQHVPKKMNKVRAGLRVRGIASTFNRLFWWREFSVFSIQLLDLAPIVSSGTIIKISKEEICGSVGFTA